MILLLDEKFLHFFVQSHVVHAPNTILIVELGSILRSVGVNTRLIPEENMAGLVWNYASIGHLFIELNH